MANDTIIVTESGEVMNGLAIPSCELTSLRDHLHNKIEICQTALSIPRTGNIAKSGSGETFGIGELNSSEDCEFCTTLAAQILARYELKERV